MGVSQLASKVRTRYLVTSCVLNGLQALTSLIVVILWASVNREIKNIEPNCVIQVSLSFIGFLSGAKCSYFCISPSPSLFFLFVP
jgi:hypothetical protein